MALHTDKALKLNYEQFHDYVKDIVNFRLDDANVQLFDATNEVVSEIFEELRADSELLKKFCVASNEYFEIPFNDDIELEQHIKDSVVETIRDDEIYMSMSSGGEK